MKAGFLLQSSAVLLGHPLWSQYPSQRQSKQRTALQIEKGTLYRFFIDQSCIQSFVIRIAKGSEGAATISRKYNEFKQLHKLLKEEFPSIQLPDIPSKKDAPVDAENKKAVLQSYLNELIKQNLLENSKVSTFLSENYTIQSDSKDKQKSADSVNVSQEKELNVEALLTQGKGSIRIENYEEVIGRATPEQKLEGNVKDTMALSLRINDIKMQAKKMVFFVKSTGVVLRNSGQL
eukprot:TRINITY_DN1197_c0_g1_i1.p2 TRINITY_DN1197_c0_g1~~TRINITY_DN1197_c0_g1_i1.p2  ORF type:complete len:234 (+),score=17.17 TRINITY_DN1197_c0_g1_i1:773-1474(+)